MSMNESLAAKSRGGRALSAFLALPRRRRLAGCALAVALAFVALGLVRALIAESIVPLPGWLLLFLLAGGLIVALLPRDATARADLLPAHLMVALVTVLPVGLAYLESDYYGGPGAAMADALQELAALVVWPFKNGVVGGLVALAASAVLLAMEPKLRPVIIEVFKALVIRMQWDNDAKVARYRVNVVHFDGHAQRLRVRIEAYWVTAALMYALGGFIFLLWIEFIDNLTIRHSLGEEGMIVALMILVASGVVMALGAVPAINGVTAHLPDSAGPSRTEWQRVSDGKGGWAGWQQVTLGAAPVAPKVDHPPAPKDEHGSAEWLKPGDLKDMGFTE